MSRGTIVIGTSKMKLRVLGFQCQYPSPLDEAKIISPRSAVMVQHYLHARSTTDTQLKGLWSARGLADLVSPDVIVSERTPFFFFDCCFVPFGFPWLLLLQSSIEHLGVSLKDAADISTKKILLSFLLHSIPECRVIAVRGIPHKNINSRQKPHGCVLDFVERILTGLNTLTFSGSADRLSFKRHTSFPFGNLYSFTRIVVKSHINFFPMGKEELGMDEPEYMPASGVAIEHARIIPHCVVTLSKGFLIDPILFDVLTLPAILIWPTISQKISRALEACMKECGKWS